MKLSHLLLALFHLAPFAVTWGLVYRACPLDRSPRKKAALIAACAAGAAANGASCLLLYRWRFHGGEVDWFKRLVQGSCTYQILSRFGLGLAILLLISVFWGFAISLVLFRRLPRFDRRQKIRLLAAGCTLLLPFAAVLLALSQNYHSVKISGFCRKSTLHCDAGYLTVTNTGNLPYNVGEISLGDGEPGSEQIFFSEQVLQPGESCTCRIEPDTRVNFSGKGGDTVYLYSSGTVIDSLQLPALERDDRYVLADGVWQLVSGQKVYVETPVFSAPGGFYDRSFALTITAPAGTRVYYTLDCSDPDGDATEYTGPIRVYDKSGEQNRFVSLQNLRRDYLRYPNPNTQPVDKCFVVRAVAVDADGNCSDIVTQSYFIGLDQYKNKNVLSLVSDPEGLFSDKTGICVTGSAYDEQYLRIMERTPDGQEPDLTYLPAENYMKRGFDWERAASMELFEDSELLLSQPIGMRVQGDSTRYYHQMKRFSLYSRKIYSESSLFQTAVVNDSLQHSFVLRDGEMHIFSQLIARGRDVETFDYLPVVIFVDGEYWAEHYLLEKADEDNLAQKYGLNKDFIVVHKEKTSLDTVQRGENSYSEIYAFIAGNDMSVGENYAAYGKIVDIQSYIDLICLRSFIGDYDYTEERNTMIWHTVRAVNDGVGDSRWRFGLYDADCLWPDAAHKSGLPAYEIDPFTVKQPSTGISIEDLSIFSALRQNEQFCQQYLLTYADLLNTAFTPQNVAAILCEMDWQNEAVTEFFSKRAEYMNTYVAREFGLTGSLQPVTLTADGPADGVTLNTVTPDLSTEWTGVYFTDYPVTVTANGAGFDHWEITANGKMTNSNQTTVSVPVTEGGVRIHAVFQ